MKDLEIAEFSVKSGSGSGESYGGDLFRIRIGAPDASYYSFILKTPHSDDYKRSIVTVYDFYGKEGTFYQKYSQPLHEILKSAGEYERLTPELIYCNEDDHVLILKNLSPEGYLPGVRGIRLCYATAEVVMRKMAKLHASSMVLNWNMKGQLEELAFDMFCKDGPFLEHFLWFFDDLTEAIRSSEDKDYESILLKLKVIKEDYPNLAHRATTSKRGLNALNHGDLWYTNVLAKKTGSIVEDVQLIDFQLMGWASISTDLLCFFFRSLNEEDYQHGFDELVKVYHDNLSRVLLKMNYPKIPSLDDILAELKDNFLHGTFSGVLYQ